MFSYEIILEGLGSKEPRFNFFTFDDVNAVSGRKKRRTVANPNREMKELQQRFLRFLRSGINEVNRDQALLSATSSSPGDSPLKNANRHIHNRYFYLIDFSNAYSRVDAGKLAHIVVQFPSFTRISAAGMEEFLRKYFFGQRCGLIQGGPASQELFNIYVGRLVDARIRELLTDKRILYTRYIDDLTFSSNSPITSRIRRSIREPIIEANFLINHRKCECVDLTKRTVMITGIGIATGGRIFIPRQYVRKLRGILHRVRTKGDVDTRRVRGMVNSVVYQLRTQKDLNRLEKRVLHESENFLKRSQ